MKNKIDYHETDGFKKDFKKLQKRFVTLSDDFEVAKRNAIELLHLKSIDNNSIVLIPSYQHEKYQVYKLRKFACRALKGRGVKSGIRIIYAYDKSKMAVTFIEIYFKADQERENKERIESFLESSE